MVEDFLVTAPGFAANLPEGAGKGGALGGERDDQGHVGDKRILVVAARKGQQALEDREPASGDEDAERRQQRPEVPLLTVAEWVVPVGRAFRLAQGRQQECLIEGVGSGVRGFGEHRAGSADDPGNQLGHADHDVRRASDDDGPPGGFVTVAVFHRSTSCPSKRHQTATGPERIAQPAAAGRLGAHSRSASPASSRPR